MKYVKRISAEIIPLNIINDYGLVNTSYIGKCSNWIYRALRTIIMPELLVIKNYEFEVSNGRAYIPDNIESIYRILINGNRGINCYDFTLPITEVMKNADIYTANGDTYPDSTNLIHYISPELEQRVFGEVSNSTTDPFSTYSKKRWFKDKCQGKLEKYRIDRNWIHTELQEAKVELYAGTSPCVYSNHFDQTFPLIPDDQPLIELLTQYCLHRILLSGEIHPILNLKEQNPSTNPSVYWNMELAHVIGRLRSLDRMTSDMISDIIGTTII